MQFMTPSVSFHLNSEDIYDESLALEKLRAKGGTMLLWDSSLDPFLTILPTDSSSILPCRLCMPGCRTSYHFCIYFPTAGQDDKFVELLADLSNFLCDIYEKGDGELPIFIRGDANASSRNASRSTIFNHFLSQHNLHRTILGHNTYHHFIGDGQFDSDLDVLLYSNIPNCTEILTDILCKHRNPLLESHHDLIISSFSLPSSPPAPASRHLITAPKIPNDRQKVLWSEEGVAEYAAAAGPGLAGLRERWEGSLSSPSCMSVLLSSTYSLLKSTAAATNRVINLGEDRPKKAFKSQNIA